MQGHITRVHSQPAVIEEFGFEVIEHLPYNIKLAL